MKLIQQMEKRKPPSWGPGLTLEYLCIPGVVDVPVSFQMFCPAHPPFQIVTLNNLIPLRCLLK